MNFLNNFARSSVFLFAASDFSRNKLAAKSINSREVFFDQKEAVLPVRMAPPLKLGKSTTGGDQNYLLFLGIPAPPGIKPTCSKG